MDFQDTQQCYTWPYTQKESGSFKCIKRVIGGFIACNFIKISLEIHNAKQLQEISAIKVLIGCNFCLKTLTKRSKKI